MSFLSEYPWWILLLAGIGVLAILTAIVSLFFKLGDRPSRIWSDELAAVDSDGFLRPIAALLGAPVRRGGTLELINNGDAWVTALLADVSAARHSVTFSVYIWEPGEMSDQIFEALAERARAGVEVRVLLDGLGCMRCPEEGIKCLEEAGGRVAQFRPAHLGKLMRFHQRNHRRAIVIDGVVGYTGGIAVGDKWLGDARDPGEWRDTMVRITGCPVESVQSAFTELWAYVSGEVLTGEAFFPQYQDGDSSIRSVGLVSSPAPEEHPLGLLLFMTFLASRKRLWITTPYFVPDEHTLGVIKRQARTGVDVRLLLPNEHIDARLIRRASQRYYEQLMDAGVRIYEYQTTMMHTKHIVVDGKFSIIGSANLDIRSRELNHENVIGVLDPEFAGTLESTFEKDLEQSLQIDPVQWKQRSPGARILEYVLAFFNKQF
ncbi:MAG: cardiolipin synthase [Longimicrobiales bacterium]